MPAAKRTTEGLVSRMAASRVRRQQDGMQLSDGLWWSRVRIGRDAEAVAKGGTGPGTPTTGGRCGVAGGQEISCATFNLLVWGTGGRATASGQQSLSATAGFSQTRAPREQGPHELSGLQASMEVVQCGLRREG